MAIELTEETFDQHVLNETKPVLVDFWAEWCGPCRLIAPVLEELSNEYKDKAVIAKVSVDDNPTITEKYKVINIPTMLFFKNGVVVDKLIGASNKATIIQKLNSLV